MTRQIKACLFDMDGLLLNTEDVYTASFSTILRNKCGIPQGLTWDVKMKMMGLQGPEACQALVDALHLEGKITNLELFRLSSEEQEKLWGTVQFLPGALELLKYLSSHGVPIALCTSSGDAKFLQKTAHLQEGFKLFGDNVVTGDHPEVKGRGKPLPYVWWTGLKLINRTQKEAIKPEECLVFEDAIPGFLSGKASKGYVIWVPDERAVALMKPGFVEEMVGSKNEYGRKYKSLEEFKPEEYGL